MIIWGVHSGELRGVVEDLIAGAVDRGRAQEQCLVGDIGGSHPGFEGAAARFCLLGGCGISAGLLRWLGVGWRVTGQVGGGWCRCAADRGEAWRTSARIWLGVPRLGASASSFSAARVLVLMTTR
jgi:hypothetical protein